MNIESLDARGALDRLTELAFRTEGAKAESGVVRAELDRLDSLLLVATRHQDLVGASYEIMQREKEHGWAEAEREEARRRRVTVALAAQTERCDAALDALTVEQNRVDGAKALITGARDWKPCSSRDAGEVVPFESFMDFLDALQDALEDFGRDKT